MEPAPHMAVTGEAGRSCRVYSILNRWDAVGPLLCILGVVSLSGVQIFKTRRVQMTKSTMDVSSDQK